MTSSNHSIADRENLPLKFFAARRFNFKTGIYNERTQVAKKRRKVRQLLIISQWPGSSSSFAICCPSLTRMPSRIETFDILMEIYKLRTQASS